MRCNQPGNRRVRSIVFICFATLLVPALARTVDLHDTMLLSEPAVCRQQIAFIYAGDLWVAGRDGNGVRRLTTHPGEEHNPRFSPDGSLLAFSASYDGNVDVFVVPVAGGEPRRLTWHPGDDMVQGFTPDGAAVLFSSPRSAYTKRFLHLFTVPVSGGFPQQLPVPHGVKASFAADGQCLAYTPLQERFRQWKNYRGGTITRIWLLDLDDLSVTQVPQPPGRCNDTDPMWLGDELCFISDRNGELNLFSFDPGDGSITQLTHHDDFPVVNASAGDGVVIYEQAGSLHLYDPAAERSERLVIGVASDLLETRPRRVSSDEHVRSAGLSPSGARAVFGYRGEIVTVPASKGDVRILTDTPGVHERHPAWSPDGREVAYFSDRDGEYALHVAPGDGRGEARVYPLQGAGFYEDLAWSPDGSHVSFTDCSWSLWVLELAGGSQVKVSSETRYGPARTLRHAWSPDSQWLVYTRNTATYLNQVFLYSLQDQESYPVTNGLSDATEPVFDSGGKYLYMAASTDAGPVREWFSMSNADMEMTSSLYLVVLAAGLPSPLARQSDEEEGPGTDTSEAEEQQEEGSRPVAVEIDLEDLGQRIVALPTDAADYSQLSPGEAGKLYYCKRQRRAARPDPKATGNLCRFELETRKEEVLLEGVRRFFLSADHRKVLVQTEEGWRIAETGKPIDPTGPLLATSDIEVRIDPRAEWAQIFAEAWRINRDYFYDPGMHGADWPAMREKYAVFLPHLTTRDDLTRVVQWMCSELAVGHHRQRGGDDFGDPESVPGGLLGADFEIDQGRYRFSRVLGGLNWNPDLRSPLTEPGVEVSAGDYLLAIDGIELRPPDNPFRLLEDTAGRIVDITVATDPDGTQVRTVPVVPIDNELALRNRDWVEGNLRRVHAATGGRVAYVYVPDTAGRGHTYFKRYFFPQADREAIIIDERYNGGGQVADYYIDILRRPLLCHWATRYGSDIKTPLSSIQGPKVMLIDETAGSGGDLLPWMFAKLELGTLVGRRTWGGLVGVLGFPVLMDGGTVTAPNIGIWTEEGFVVENVGVPPDIEVEQWPAEVAAGRDPQLEKAIEVVLEQLPAEPPAPPQRPPFPVRARR